jgi:HEAT repeat protein
VVRRIVATDLGIATLGRDDKIVIPALVEALKDVDPLVRANAGESLKKLDPEAAIKAGVK